MRVRAQQNVRIREALCPSVCLHRVSAVTRRRIGAGKLESPRSVYHQPLTISARNQLRGKVDEVRLGDAMAHVVVRVGENRIESASTRRGADELKLKKGDTVTAGIKATQVMIQKD
jgi:molybdopterin-binding protein